MRHCACEMVRASVVLALLNCRPSVSVVMVGVAPVGRAPCEVAVSRCRTVHMVGAVFLAHDWRNRVLVDRSGPVVAAPNELAISDAGATVAHTREPDVVTTATLCQRAADLLSNVDCAVAIGRPTPALVLDARAWAHQRAHSSP